MFLFLNQTINNKNNNLGLYSLYHRALKHKELGIYLSANFYGNCSPSTLQEFKEKVQPKEEAYLRAKAMASIYLDGEADKIMSEALGAFRQASMSIWLSLPNNQCPVNKNSYSPSTKHLNWSDFKGKYDKAVACLKEMINPKILESVEKTKQMP